jgi:hypothetical protein
VRGVWGIGDSSTARAVPAAVSETLPLTDAVAVMTAAIAMRQDPRIADQIRPETRPSISSIMVSSPSVRGSQSLGKLAHEPLDLVLARGLTNESLT